MRYKIDLNLEILLSRAHPSGFEEDSTALLLHPALCLVVIEPLSEVLRTLGFECQRQTQKLLINGQSYVIAHLVCV